MARVRGFTKVGNEVAWIGDTLDVWAPICTEGIHVYCDCCTDGTADVCRSHPAVVEVVESNLYDPDRARADQVNRQILLTSVKRYLETRDDWVAYFDADEHLTGLDPKALDMPNVNAILPWWYDVYITPEDENTDYRLRQWVSEDPREIPMIFRNSPILSFTMPDQRIMNHRGPYARAGHLRHYGLGRSVGDWERKVGYYQEWPQYSEKWGARSGQAVRTDYTSVKGTPLRLYSELRGEREHRGLRPVD